MGTVVLSTGVCVLLLVWWLQRCCSLLELACVGLGMSIFFSSQIPVFSTFHLGDSTLGDLSLSGASVTPYLRHMLSL